MSHQRIRLSLTIVIVAVLAFSSFLPAGAAPAALPEASAENLVTQVGLAPRTPNILLFNQAFSYFNMGYASSMAVALFAIVMGASLLLIRVRRTAAW